MIIPRHKNKTLTLILAITISLFFSMSLLADEKGKEIYTNKGCVACHTIGDGKLSGPDLLGVTKRREEQWLKNWLKSPETMLQTDPIAKEMLKEFYVPMPNLGLTDEEIEQLIIYFKKNDEQVKN
jgi:nitrite reductase (NO-forming)